MLQSLRSLVHRGADIQVVGWAKSTTNRAAVRPNVIRSNVVQDGGLVLDAGGRLLGEKGASVLRARTRRLIRRAQAKAERG